MSSKIIKLGKLEIVPLREIWLDEAKDFTPWIASQEGLEELSEVIGLNLELLDEEHKVGSFSADVLAKDTNDEDHLILIENQLEKTNHDHLGKTITYAAGLGVKTVIWIARNFTLEHRQAVDWLNENTAENVGFFGIEIETLRIGKSAPAPHLKIISQPNEWAKMLKSSGSSKMTDTKIDQQNFWQDLKEHMADNFPSIRTQTPSPQHWYNISIGKSGIHISFTVNSREGKGACDLTITGNQAKNRFDKLFAQKQQIEKELNLKLEWLRLDDKTSSRILIQNELDYQNEEQRRKLIEWMAETSAKFHKAFSTRIKKLK